MKKIFLIQISLVFISLNATSQNLSPKEKAVSLAKNEFSKARYMKKEKYGVVVEKKKVIESTAVIKDNLSFYEGNYVSKDLQYKIEIRTDKQAKPMATLSIANEPAILLIEVSITDAFFHAVKQNPGGTEEVWEGVFINKNDDGNVEFGLGVILPKPIQFIEGLKIIKTFLEKVSP